MSHSFISRCRAKYRDLLEEGILLHILVTLPFDSLVLEKYEGVRIDVSI